MYDTQFWNWKPADQTWRDYYARAKGIEFETLTDMYEVIDRFRGPSKGWSFTIRASSSRCISRACWPGSMISCRSGQTWPRS